MDPDMKILFSAPEHTKTLVKFQCDMASETGPLKLDPELVAKGIDYLHQKKGYGFYFVGLNPNEA